MKGETLYFSLLKKSDGMIRGLLPVCSRPVRSVYSLCMGRKLQLRDHMASFHYKNTKICHGVGSMNNEKKPHRNLFLALKELTDANSTGYTV